MNNSQRREEEEEEEGKSDFLNNISSSSFSRQTVMDNHYPSIITIDQNNHSRLYDPSYSHHPYSSYGDYPTPSKLEALDYNYWPSAITTIPSSTGSCMIDQIPSTSTTNSAIETLVPVHMAQMNATTSISATLHHHHIHQHLYPHSGPSSTNETSPWLSPSEYPSPTASYRHYPYSNNNFYEASQWSTPPPPNHSIKFETPYSPPSYLDSSHHLDQTFPDSKREPSEYSDEQLNSFKNQLNPVPPKNPANGKTRTRDKYRIVYTDRQRYELENEFAKAQYISIPRKAALSSALALSERQIKIWFQNRRAKERKLKKKRQEICSRQLNHSTDADSASDGDMESPTYYQHFM